jgi:hypothetical protein
MRKTRFSDSQVLAILKKELAKRVAAASVP